MLNVVAVIADLDPDDLDGRLDARLIEGNLDYKTHREHDYAMQAPVLVALAPGTFYEWARRHNQLGGQHKVPRVAPSAEMAQELQGLSKNLEEREG